MNIVITTLFILHINLDNNPKQSLCHAPVLGYKGNANLSAKNI